ncbi:MAG TPA: tRNA 2-thiouridine(34) synthase MnmA [Thermoanaerobaculia bacterium]|jgi:tRNA-specific 2-thiouridylase|nr:tRNA 2-thiouridine(34) synthase MnmA [Thermoanaerobaculia bacterium]
MSDLVAVAMSGGLDSSVAAWLLSRQQPVVGLSMLLWDHSDRPRGSGRCCGALDLGDARRVAQQAGIPHYTLRMDEEFRRDVVDPFVADYLDGRTPSPCVRCNTFIKFDALLARARALGAGRVATGHYARIVDGPDGPELHRGADEAKDQSYFLFELTREQLAASLFPLGELRKKEVRQLARDAGLVVAEKGESMEICFVDGAVEEFVAAQAAARPERFGAVASAPATVVAENGEVLGEGAPYYRYTVGQRRGLGVAAGHRLYVLRVLPAENRVVVGDEEALAARGLTGERLSWIGEPPTGEAEVTVRIRSRHAGVAARVRPLAGGRAEVEFASPQRGVAPGQAAVFYEGSRVLGGCWIEGDLK